MAEDRMAGVADGTNGAPRLDLDDQDGLPRHVETHLVRSAAFEANGQVEEAAEALRQALDHLDTKNKAKIYCNICDLYRRHGLASKALDAIENALSNDAALSQALGLKGKLLLNTGRAKQGSDVLKAAMGLNTTYRPDYLFSLYAVAGLSQAEIDREHRRAFLDLAPPTLPKPAPKRRRSVTGPLRIGFLSSDLKRHPVGRLSAGLFRRLDRTRAWVSVFSTQPDEDYVSAFIKAHADHWVSAARLSDAALRARIQATELDVLIDLNGLSGNTKLPILSQRLAPLQATWLGYPGRVFMPGIDIMISDRFLAQGLEGAPGDGGEAVVTLPAPYCRWVYVPTDRNRPDPTPGRPDRFRMIAPHRSTKLTDPALSLWAAVCRHIPDSDLVIVGKLNADPAIRSRVVDAFRRHGVDPGRVTLREAFGWTDYIQALADADLFLDSTPFTGGMTTCDALWVGTPIVTLATPTFAGQQTAALLRAVGAGGHIATSPESYVRGAMRLAADRAGSGPRRDGLRTAFDRSALRDLTGFATRFLDLIEAQFAA